MGRPMGSKNKLKDDNGEGVSFHKTDLRNTVSGDELLAYIKRIEECNEAQKETSADRSQVFKELRQAGYNRDTVRALVARRKLTLEEREAADALYAEYSQALGEFRNTPLGQAMAPAHDDWHREKPGT
jgi:uncharacterized protein (UPF0335 family)